MIAKGETRVTVNCEIVLKLGNSVKSIYIWLAVNLIEFIWNDFDVSGVI